MRGGGLGCFFVYVFLSIVTVYFISFFDARFERQFLGTERPHLGGGREGNEAGRRKYIGRSELLPCCKLLLEVVFIWRMASTVSVLMTMYEHRGETRILRYDKDELV